jgi:hypothetical protein
MDNEEYSVRTGWTKRPSDIDKLAPALVKAQGMIEGAVKDAKNEFFKGPKGASKYATLTAVWDAAKPALQANGLAVLQLPCVAPHGHVGLTTVVLHESGQSISEKFYMPLKDASNPQAAGSAITYARRYALSSVLGICPEDDDGNTAAKGGATPKEALRTSTVDHLKEWMDAFEKAKSAAEKKEVFMRARGTNLPEPEKTELLTKLSSVIKGMK